MKLKILSFAVALFCALHVSAAEPSGSCGTNLTWRFSNNTLIISGTGAMNNYTSTNTAPWHDYITNIKSISLPNGITTIGNNSLRGIQISSLTLPVSLESIGSNAFQGCFCLEKVILGSGTSKLTQIGSDAFNRCTSLRVIELPASLTSIGANAFYNNERLETIYYHGTLAQWASISIGNYVFRSSYNASSIILNANYATSNGDLLIHANFPEGTTVVKQNAFYYARCIATLTIPSTMSTIEANAFNSCTNLQKITVNRVTPPAIQSNTFYGVSTDIEVLVPCGTLAAYQADANWSRFTNIKEMPAEGPLAPGVYMKVTTNPAKVYEFDTRDIESVEYREVTE